MSTTPPEIKYDLNQDKSSVTISIDGKDVVFTTVEFERLIGWLGVIRAQMTPSVPPAVQEGMQVSQLSHVFLGHRKGMPPGPLESGMVIAVRSDLFGWLEFTAAPEFCSGMVDWMKSGGKTDVEPTPPPVA
jgi:hypothetical protein